MFSISESLYVELHLLRFEDIKEIQASFEEVFPYTMEVFLTESDYHRMVEDARELAGEEHPERAAIFSDDYNWGEYHPTKTHVYRNGQLLLQTKIGFKHRNAALQFKLKWFQS